MSRRIRASGLSKRYGTLLALDGVGFEVAEGQSIALIGPNGAGKSSLLRIFGGITRPDSGLLEGLADFRSSYVPDGIEFPRGSSALSWLAFAARIKGAATGRREALSLASRALESLGLGAHAHREAALFSRGMKQRLLFAQALIGGPELLLMDEPASGLDPVWTIEWKQRLGALKAGGATIIFSTHRIDDASALSDRLLLLDGGKILLDEDSAAWRGGEEGDAERRFLSLLGRRAA
jgi:Cu-processing system ATP-binding protein